LIALQLNGVIQFKEDVANTILSGFWKDASDFSFNFPLEKFMGDCRHDTSTITIPAISTSSTSVHHGTKKLMGIGDYFVTRLTLSHSCVPHPDNQTMSHDMQQLPFAVASGSLQVNYI
jgi:hypothetical protein